MHPFHQGLARYFSPNELAVLASVTIGIAGVGGLGSNACMLLARSGICHFVLVDCDRVDASNLNRQHFFPEDIGKEKVKAMASYLTKLNPAIEVEALPILINEDTIDTLLPKAPIWLEALDGAQNKALFVNAALIHKAKVVSASGLGGYGGGLFSKKTLGNLVLVGDFERDIATHPPFAPRVVWASAMMCDSVLELLLGCR